MARLRQAEGLPAPTGGVPVELLDQHHPVWSDSRSVARWRTANGLPPCPPFDVQFIPLPGEPAYAGVNRAGRIRHHRAASDWARVHNITRPDHPTWVDHRRLRVLLQGAI